MLNAVSECWQTSIQEQRFFAKRLMQNTYRSCFILVPPTLSRQR
jgi:hypothetical protein